MSRPILHGPIRGSLIDRVNAVGEAVGKHQRLAVGTTGRIVSNRAGMSVDFNGHDGISPSRTNALATVLIIEEPTANTRKIRVREVAYTQSYRAPIESDPRTDVYYRWVGGGFDALPFVGLRAISYAGLAYQVTNDNGIADPPKQTTLALNARQVSPNVWMLDKPFESNVEVLKWAVVTGAGSGSFITVRFVKPTPTGGFEYDGDAHTVVKVQPNTNAEDFARWVSSVLFVGSTMLVPVFKYAGQWQAWQQPGLKIGLRDLTARVSSC